jgi:hypothetical protein
MLVPKICWYCPYNTIWTVNDNSYSPEHGIWQCFTCFPIEGLAGLK